MPFQKFYGFEADEVARRLLPLSSKQARHCFVMGNLVTGSFHGKLIAAKPYASRLIVMLKLQPILRLQGQDRCRAMIILGRLESAF